MFKMMIISDESMMEAYQGEAGKKKNWALRPRLFFVSGDTFLKIMAPARALLWGNETDRTHLEPCAWK